MISSYSIQHLPSKSFMTGSAHKMQHSMIRELPSICLISRLNIMLDNFLLLFWRNVPNQLDFSQGPAYCPVTVAEFAVLIKIVTRLRVEVTRLSPCLIWHPDNVDILQWKTMEPLCRAATCHHPPAWQSSLSSPQLRIWSEVFVPF